MMSRDPRDKSPSTKQEPGLQDVDRKPVATSVRARATSRSWPGLKDPRVVRVSRAFGGKDRHSKVSTVRGLRDRRVRLSVQTAIQLYDLQDRLGLSQPSKVVDWLLDAAQHEIDKLPPLQIPPGSCLIQYPLSHSAAASHGALGLPQARPSASSMAALNMEHMEENGAGSLALLPDREGSYDRDHVELQMAPLPRDQHHGVEDIPVHSNLHRLGFLSMPNSSNGSNSSNSYASYCLLEASNLFAPPHLASYSMTQAEESHGYRSTAPPTPSLSLSHASQLLPSLFSPYVTTTTSTDQYEPKHANNSSTIFQLMGSSTASQNSKHQQFWNGGQESVDEG